MNAFSFLVQCISEPLKYLKLRAKQPGLSEKRVILSSYPTLVAWDKSRCVTHSPKSIVGNGCSIQAREQCPQWIPMDNTSNCAQRLYKGLPRTGQGRAGQEDTSSAPESQPRQESRGRDFLLQGQWHNPILPSLTRKLWRAVQEMPKWRSEKQEQRGEVTYPSKSPNIYCLPTVCQAQCWALGIQCDKHQIPFLPSCSLPSRGVTGSTQSHK